MTLVIKHKFLSAHNVTLEFDSTGGTPDAFGTNPFFLKAKLISKSEDVKNALHLYRYDGTAYGEKVSTDSPFEGTAVAVYYSAINMPPETGVIWRPLDSYPEDYANLKQADVAILTKTQGEIGWHSPERWPKEITGSGYYLREPAGDAIYAYEIDGSLKITRGLFNAPSPFFAGRCGDVKQYDVSEFDEVHEALCRSLQWRDKEERAGRIPAYIYKHDGKLCFRAVSHEHPHSDGLQGNYFYVCKWPDENKNTVEMKMPEEVKPVQQPAEIDAPEADVGLPLTPVNPSHYRAYLQDTEFMWLDVMSQIPTLRDPEKFQAAIEMQVRKYLDRNGQKDSPLQELKKAKWYLSYWIQYLENGCKPIMGKDVK